MDSVLMVEKGMYLGTRHMEAPPIMKSDLPKSRLGRRESEPHSDEINYIYDVLSPNFPEDRTFWDLRHYFFIDEEKVDLQFDISYFKGLQVPFRISSYDASKYANQVPSMAVNILSASTYRNDLGIVLEQCQRLEIPVYVMFSDHLQAPSYVKAPLLKVYYRDGDQYHVAETREICCKEGEIPDQSKMIDILPDLLPFKIGIMERKDKYFKEKISPLYFLVFVDRGSGKLLLPRWQKERERAKEAERQAELERERAKEAKKQMELERERAKEAERQAELERERAKEAKKQAELERKRAKEAEKKIMKLQEELENLKKQMGT